MRLVSSNSKWLNCRIRPDDWPMVTAVGVMEPLRKKNSSAQPVNVPLTSGCVSRSTKATWLSQVRALMATIRVLSSLETRLHSSSRTNRMPGSSCLSPSDGRWVFHSLIYTQIPFTPLNEHGHKQNYRPRRCKRLFSHGLSHLSARPVRHLALDWTGLLSEPRVLLLLNQSILIFDFYLSDSGGQPLS